VQQPLDALIVFRPQLNFVKVAHVGVVGVGGRSAPKSVSIAIAAGCALAGASQRPDIWRVVRKRKQYPWEVSRIGGSSAKFIGSVYAADENQALAAAIKQLEIRPADQWRLLLRRT
jgi:hypothetical protein